MAELLTVLVLSPSDARRNNDRQNGDDSSGACHWHLT